MEKKTFLLFTDECGTYNKERTEKQKRSSPFYVRANLLIGLDDMGYADDYICEADTVVVGRKGSINNPIFVEEPFWNVDTAFGLVANRQLLMPKYLYYFCVNFDFEKLNTTVTIPSLTKANLLEIDINIPELDQQKAVIEQLDKVVELITKKRDQLNSLDLLVKSIFVEMFGDPLQDDGRYEKVVLESVAEVGSSKRIFEKEYVS